MPGVLRVRKATGLLPERHELLRVLEQRDTGGGNKMKNLKDVLEILTKDMDDKDIASMYLKTSIAAEITTQRIKKGMTKSALAKKIGVSDNLICRWEDGIGNYNINTLVKIADALDMGIRSPFVTDVNVGDEEGEIE